MSRRTTLTPITVPEARSLMDGWIIALQSGYADMDKIVLSIADTRDRLHRRDTGKTRPVKSTALAVVTRDAA